MIYRERLLGSIFKRGQSFQTAGGGGGEKSVIIMANSWSSSYKLQNVVKVLYRYRIGTGKNPSPQESYRGGLISKFGSISMHDGLRFISTNTGKISSTTKATTTDSKVKDDDDKNKVQPSVPAPRKPFFPTWAKWFFGSILSMLLPFWTQKWSNLLSIEGKVEEVVEEVEIVAEVLEKVADTVEKVSAEVADQLTENGKLKEVALFVEHAASVTAKDAKLTEDFIHKVEGLKHDLTDLGTMVEPVIDKIIAKEHGGN